MIHGWVQFLHIQLPTLIADNGLLTLPFPQSPAVKHGTAITLSPQLVTVHMQIIHKSYSYGQHYNWIFANFLMIVFKSYRLSWKLYMMCQNFVCDAFSNQKPVNVWVLSQTSGTDNSSEVVLYPLKPIDVVIRHSVENSVTVVVSRKHNEACDHVLIQPDPTKLDLYRSDPCRTWPTFDTKRRDPNTQKMQKYEQLSQTVENKRRNRKSFQIFTSRCDRTRLHPMRDRLRNSSVR